MKLKRGSANALADKWISRGRKAMKFASPLTYIKLNRQMVKDFAAALSQTGRKKSQKSAWLGRSW